MAIAFDAVSTGNTNNAAVSSPLQWNHTCTSGAQLLVFLEANTATAISVTYNGVSLTFLGTASDTFGTPYNIYALQNAASGTNQISVSWTGGSLFISGFGISYTGMNVGALDASASNTNGSGLSVSATITTVANNAWVVGLGRSATGFVSFTGLTTRASNGLGGQQGTGDSNAPITPAGNVSVTMNGSSGSVDNFIFLVSFAPITFAGEEGYLFSSNPELQQIKFYKKEVHEF